MITKLVIVGSKGRMGQTILQCIAEDQNFAVLKAVDVDSPSLEPGISGAHALIEFAMHSATRESLEKCLAHGVPAIIGTTGHTEEELRNIRQAAEKIPVVFTSNFSTGMNLLFYLVRRTAETLGDEFDQEVIEMHHRMKKDAPSGSALTLAQVLADVKNKPLSVLLKHGRSGETGARSRDEIGIHALRGGGVVGDHRVIFSAMGEQLELSHRAFSRETFARGALRAAKWAVGRPPGLYSMLDVLGLSNKTG